MTIPHDTRVLAREILLAWAAAPGFAVAVVTENGADFDAVAGHAFDLAVAFEAEGKRREEAGDGK